MCRARSPSTCPGSRRSTAGDQDGLQSRHHHPEAAAVRDGAEARDRTVLQPRTVTDMVSQTQTQLVPQTYTESVPVTTTRQVVEEQGGYELRSVPVTVTVPGCAPGTAGAFAAWRPLLEVRRRSWLRPQVRSPLRRRLRPVWRHRGRRICGRSRTVTQTTYTCQQVYVSRPVVRSVPETTYVNQTKSRMVPVQRSSRFRSPGPSRFP